MQNIKLHWIEIVLLIGILVFLGVQAKNETGIFSGRSSGGDSAQAEFVVFDGQQQSLASFSADVSDNAIYIEGDPGAVFASPSVGNVVMFNTASSFDDSILTEDTAYYVVSTSYADLGTTASNSDRFQVSTTKGGSEVDFASTASGSDGKYFFTQEMKDAVAFDAGSYEFKTITINAEEVASVGFKIVGSDMETAPDWYASQSSTNRYDNVAVYDLQNNTELEGDTGITISGTDTNSIYQVYANNLKWLFVKSSNYASGSVDIRIKGF